MHYFKLRYPLRVTSNCAASTPARTAAFGPHIGAEHAAHAAGRGVDRFSPQPEASWQQAAGASDHSSGLRPTFPLVPGLYVPKTLSRSCDQAIFVDQATDASLPSDAVVLKVGRFG